MADQSMWFDEQPEIPAQEAILDEDGETVLTPEVAYEYACHSIRTSVEIHMFSESLQQGIILIVQFIAFQNDSEEDMLMDGISPADIYYEILDSTYPLPKCGLCVTYGSA